MIRYGYKWFNGVVLCDAHTDTYNNLTKIIETATGTYKERLENARHKFLIQCFEINK